MRRRFLLALCVLLSVVSVSSGQSNRIIVMLKNDSLCQPIAMRTMDAQVSDIPIALADVAERCGNVEIKKAMPHRSSTRNSQFFPFHRLYVIQVSSNQDINSVLALLENNENVEYSERDVEISFYTDPRYDNGEQWYLHNTTGKPSIEMEHAWGIFKGDDNNIVAVLDADGVDSEHEDLQGRIFGDALEYGKSHATQVAGIIGANSLNGVGIRGIDMNAKILSRRINPIDMVGVADIIIDAVDRGASVINCSWGAAYRKTLALAFRYAYDNGCVIVAAMGNNQGNQEQYPAAHPYVIAVGAVDEHDIRSSYSNYGNHIDVVCLGNNVLSTDIHNSYNMCTGTSFSAPIVSGVASLLKGYRPELHNDDIRQIIRRSAVKLAGMNGANFSPYYGYGRLNAGAAMEMVKQPKSIVHGFACGNNAGKTSVGKWIYTGDDVIPAGMYLGVERYKMTKRVVFDTPFLEPPVVWMRERESRCYHAGNPNSGEPYAEISNVTTTGFDLTYYVYYVPYNSAGTSVNAWVPSGMSISGVAYTAIGVKNMLHRVSLSGPTQICDAGGTFSLSNLPAGATVRWSTGNAKVLQIASGQGTARCTVVKGTSSLPGSQRVTVTLSYLGASTTLVHRVQVGTPAPSIVGPYEGLHVVNEVRPCQTYTCQVHNSQLGVKRYDWWLYGDDFPTGLSTGLYAPFSVSRPGEYTITCKQYQDGCGWSTEARLMVYARGNGCSSWGIKPNPTPGPIDIMLPINAQVEAIRSNSENANGITLRQVQVFSADGRLVLERRYPTGTANAHIDLSQLRPGTYHLLINGTEHHVVVRE